MSISGIKGKIVEIEGAIASTSTNPNVTFHFAAKVGTAAVDHYEVTDAGHFAVPEGLSGANPLKMSTSTVSYTLWATP